MEMLLPCPFCGGTSALRVLDQNEVDFLSAEDENYSENPYYQVVCCMTENSPVPLVDWQPGCGSAGGFQKTKEQAIAAWNRRPEPENKPLTLEELRERAGKPVWISGINRWGVVGKRTDCRMAIGFVYGWEWLDDVLRGRCAYDRPPKGETK